MQKLKNKINLNIKFVATNIKLEIQQNYKIKMKFKNNILNPIYIVISVWHSEGRDRTFVHGAFGTIEEAKEIETNVWSSIQYVSDEGYDIEKEHERTIQIVQIPYNQHVNEFIPTIV